MLAGYLCLKTKRRHYMKRTRKLIQAPAFLGGIAPAVTILALTMTGLVLTTL
jgi:hypothetical protein